MKHILYILPYLNLGGTEKHVLSLIQKPGSWAKAIADLKKLIAEV